MRTLIAVLLVLFAASSPVSAGQTWKRGSVTKLKEQAIKQNPKTNPKYLQEKLRSSKLNDRILEHQAHRLKTKSSVVGAQGSEATRQAPRPTGVRAGAILQVEPGHVAKPVAPKVATPKATVTQRRPSVSAPKPTMMRRPSVTIRKH